MQPIRSAHEAGLRYVSDATPGIRRRRAGRGFAYFGPSGRRLTGATTIEWIRGLAIPPAWTDVWICPSRLGHLQATGRDARGRKQYRYHPRWRPRRDRTKYGRLIAFGEALPRIRRRVARDMGRSGLPRERVLAAVVRLLEETRMRIGNEEYARDNHSYGLTTLRNRHAKVGTKRIRFHFRGKGDKPTDVEVSDARLARIVGRCQELPGQELFAYVDDRGDVHPVDSGDVNDYLREISGRDFTAKDFRTWAGTVTAAVVLGDLEPVDSEAAARRTVVRAVEHVAERLGNTPAVARSAYVHPAVIAAYQQGDVVKHAGRTSRDSSAARSPRLDPQEEAVLGLLRRRARIDRERQPRRSTA